MGQCADHFLAEQAIGGAQIRFAGRSLVAPGCVLHHAKHCRDNCVIESRKEGLVAVELRRAAKFLDDVVVVRLRKRALRRQ